MSISFTSAISSLTSSTACSSNDCVSPISTSTVVVELESVNVSPSTVNSSAIIASSISCASLASISTSLNSSPLSSNSFDSKDSFSFSKNSLFSFLSNLPKFLSLISSSTLSKSNNCDWSLGLTTVGALIITSVLTTVTDVYTLVNVWVPASLDTVTSPTRPSLSGSNVIVVTPIGSTVPVNAVPCTVIVAVGVPISTASESKAEICPDSYVKVPTLIDTSNDASIGTDVVSNANSSIKNSVLGASVIFVLSTNTMFIAPSSPVWRKSFISNR